jgi:hypothetical protein
MNAMTSNPQSITLAAIQCAAMLNATTPTHAGAQSIPLRLIAGERIHMRASDAARAVHWAEVAEIVDQWKYLPIDWDGDHSSAPVPLITDNAMRFLNVAEQRLSIPPRPYVDGPNEVGFKWKKGDGFASVAFMNDGNIVAFVRAPGSTEAYRLDEPFTEELPLRELVNALVDRL